jgi:hypothetical protein
MFDLHPHYFSRISPYCKPIANPFVGLSPFSIGSGPKVKRQEALPLGWLTRGDRQRSQSARNQSTSDHTSLLRTWGSTLTCHIKGLSRASIYYEMRTGPDWRTRWIRSVMHAPHFGMASQLDPPSHAPSANTHAGGASGHGTLGVETALDTSRVFSQDVGKFCFMGIGQFATPTSTRLGLLQVPAWR